jgi:hypothetical protein
VASKSIQWLLGLCVMLLGIGYTWWQWLDRMAHGTYRAKAAFVFPSFAVVGLMLMLFPVSQEELMARYGVTRPRRLAHFSLGQKVMLLLALAAGLLNAALMSRTGTVR